MDREITAVVFRVFPKKEGGDVIALFPEHEEHSRLIGSYMHLGQHGAASRQLVYHTRLATPDEYAPLKRELTAIGYRLRVLKRFPRRRRAA